MTLEKPVTLPRSRLTADCGPESIFAVMTYWEKPASLQQISRAMRDPRMSGVLSTDFPLLAQQAGMQATLIEGSVGRIKKAIDRRVPPIIMLEVGGGDFHFFVVSGYNDPEQTVVCEEYDGAKRLISYEELEERWQRRGGHLMVEMELSSAEADYRAAGGLEKEGFYSEAAALHRRALQADPEHYPARVGLGNCLLALGKLEEALAEYRRAYATNASDPKVCNNLANILLELKREPAEAERLADRAAEEFDATYRLAREEAEKEPRPAVRALRAKELQFAELDLAYAMGTLGQARAALGKDVPAITAWKASFDHFPLTHFDARAKRLYEIGLAHKRLQMPQEARRHWESALREVRDPALRAKIEAELK